MRSEEKTASLALLTLVGAPPASGITCSSEGRAGVSPMATTCDEVSSKPP
jgi:hypothetical protein